MKMWIIYKNGISFSNFIAEMLQDRLEDYIEVDVGEISKIEPAFIIEEKIDYLILGDIIKKEIPSLELQDWIEEFSKISKKINKNLKVISGYYVALDDINVEPSWGEFLHDNIKADIIYPPILALKIKKVECILENGALQLVKEYSRKFIEFIINI